MGGRSKRAPTPDPGDPIEPSTGPLPGGGRRQTIPAFPPGMQGLLAQQLAAGYGGLLGGGEAATPQAFNAWLDEIYEPVETRIYARPGDIPQLQEMPQERPQPEEKRGEDSRFPGEAIWVERPWGRQRQRWNGRNWDVISTVRD